jgi:hypothetical protein
MPSATPPGVDPDRCTSTKASIVATTRVRIANAIRLSTKVSIITPWCVRCGGGEGRRRTGACQDAGWSAERIGNESVPGKVGSSRTASL